MEIAYIIYTCLTDSDTTYNIGLNNSNNNLTKAHSSWRKLYFQEVLDYMKWESHTGTRSNVTRVHTHTHTHVQIVSMQIGKILQILTPDFVLCPSPLLLQSWCLVWILTTSFSFLIALLCPSCSSSAIYLHNVLWNAFWNSQTYHVTPLTLHPSVINDTDIWNELLLLQNNPLSGCSMQVHFVAFHLLPCCTFS